jgi:GrpB-like predicted nucleotidyltransferase (UPF0157 family)
MKLVPPPVIIQPYDPAWPEKFAAESRLLASVLGLWLETILKAR